MPSYNISSSNNYIIYTDQTSSVLYDTGGPAGNYGDNENIYFSIAPAYSTGTLTLKLTSFKSESTFDYLRIYSDIPPTSSFAYTATTVGGYLIGVFTGPSVTVPQTITSSTGRAYIRWNSDNSVNDTGFALEWTGSGFYTVDSSSNVTTNRYALNIPKGAVTGSVLGFNSGIFTGSSILTANKDILFGAWLKADKGNRDSTKRGIFGLGNTNGAGITIAKEAGASDFSFYYRDNNGTFTTTFTDIMMGGNSSAEPILAYIPQWHYYGVALRKTSTTGAIAYAYRDGYLFASNSITYTASWGAVSSSAATLLVGAFRTSNTIQTSNTWSGSVDDMFMATAITGAGESAFNNFYSSIYNSGNWADPNTVITGAFNTSSFSPVVLFNWRFEETGSIFNTRDYGFYGIHSASATSSGGGTLSLTPTSSGISYTPYSSLAYSASAAAVVSNATVSFTTSSASVYENTGSYVFGISILTASVGQSATASIVLTSSSDTTASIGTNYRLIYAGTTYSSSAQMPIYVSFSAGDTTTKYITASIIDNTTYTNTSASVPLKIEQGTSTNITATSPFTFTLKILDYEEGYPSFTSSSYATGEASGSILIYVDRISGSSGPLSVDYSTANETAVSGTNYTKTTGTFSWADTVTTRLSASIPILYDNIQTSNKSFAVSLSNLSTGSFSSYPSAITSSTITIVDQEPGTFKINTSSYTVTEGNSVTVQVDRYSGSFGNVTVNITSSNGTAVSGTDYTAVNENVAFTDGETTKTFSVSTIDNVTDVTGSLYFNIGIKTISASYGTGLTGSISSATINITDNESGSIKFTSSSYTGSLGNTITIPIERYNGSDFIASASIGVSGGTAVAGVDYTNIFPYTVSWADQVSGTVNISLTTLTLNSWTSDKTLILTASNLTNITTGSIMTASILIKTGVLTQSANPCPDYSLDFTINKYCNLSNQFTRKTEQVPFSLGNNPFVRLQQAYSSST